MPETSTTNVTLWNFAFRLLSSDWATLILQLWQLLSQIFAERAVGLYEVLDFEHILELCDRHGKKAIYHKQQTVRLLQDYVVAYQDQAWGLGEVFANYTCSPGVAVDRYRDGHKHQVLISLRETKRRGEIMRINIDRTVRNGFQVVEGWSETDVSHRMKHLRLVIVFPKTRHCQGISVIEKNAGRTHPLFLSDAELLPDGRQRIAWETHKPVLFETYALRWVW